MFCFTSFFSSCDFHCGIPGGSVVKNPPASARDAGSVPGSGRSPGGGNGSPLQYSCLENPKDRGALQAIVHGVTKSRTLFLYVLFYILASICNKKHNNDSICLMFADSVKHFLSLY